MSATHRYETCLVWTGNRGAGTSAYDAYDRDWDVRADGRDALRGSADPAFRGDASRHNPEDLLVASLSSCHMLWYLHLAAEAGIVVTRYEDRAVGEMVTHRGGAGEFVSVTLRPRITIAKGGDPEAARALNERAHELCFIARSVNFAVLCEPQIVFDAG
ncbi:MAG: OsmC family protein [Pseudomonadota bacterium]|nr:OsmC family protein [Pseudomonadota bacterium]